MSDFHILEQALAMHDPGDRISINQVREPLEIAQVPPSSYGGLMAAAVKHGLIEVVGIDTAGHPAARKHLVRQYRILERAHQADAA